MVTALTIAGSDSSGGAGIQADLKTFAAHGVFGLSAITAITAQNTEGVMASTPVAPDLVRAQIDSVISDIGANATKIGMLATAGIVAVVAEAIAGLALSHVVLDPVMVATGGQRLLDEEGINLLQARLLPLATVVTPNLSEAETLTGLRVRTVAEMRAAAVRLVELGAAAAIVTGGHLDGPAIDVLYDGRSFTDLEADRIETRHTHGTGCTFSSAIAARLALGDPLADAARAAKHYVTLAIERAPGLGHGRGPLGHL
jgi:hydroxymethylpyrimidine/phosphomethylpyrimidine kinase